MRQITGRIPDGPVVRVTMEGGLITGVENLGPGNGAEPLLSPGFVDLQVNGYGGFDVNRPDLAPDELASLTRRLWAEGVTAFCPTVITNLQPAILHAVQQVAALFEHDEQAARSVACIHVEGPFISPVDGARGAHRKDAVRPASAGEFREWQQASGGRIGIVTVAPEVEGATPFIEQVAATGTLVALGHTAASPEQIAAAAQAGARLSTHLGNGCPALLPRHPNHLWSQLADDRLAASLIVDGHHLPDEVVQVMMRAKSLERVVLISDSIHLGGLTPGIYATEWGEPRELRPDGRICIPGTPYLAGSSSSLRECVARAVAITGYPLSEVLPLATVQPANLLGRFDLGRIEPGARADLVLFRWDGEIHVEETIVAGESVFYQKGVGVK